MKNIPVRSIKSAEARPDASGSFKIRTMSEVLSGQDLSQDLHRHDFYFILALKKGSGKHEIDFVPHTVYDDSVFIMRPGQVHRLSLRKDADGYLMEFGKNFFHTDADKNLVRKTSNKNFCQLDEKTSTKLQSILSTIHEEFKNRNEGFSDVIKANLSIFFIELMRQRQNKETPAEARNNYAQERLQDFLQLIEKEIGMHKVVAFYADKLNLSLFQLNSITKTLLGKSAADLIKDQILLESKRYLLSTSNQVNQVAHHLGYDDVSYFIRFFKKHTGQTPEIFRQNFR